MSSNNQISLIVTSYKAEKLEIDMTYILHTHSVDVWLDGEIRVYGSLNPLPQPLPSLGNPPPTLDYESQEFQDELQEILDDTATEGDGHWRPGNLIHYLRKRGYKLVYADKEE
jgi:hypothetical protein